MSRAPCRKFLRSQGAVGGLPPVSGGPVRQVRQGACGRIPMSRAPLRAASSNKWLAVSGLRVTGTAASPNIRRGWLFPVKDGAVNKCTKGMAHSSRGRQRHQMYEKWVLFGGRCQQRCENCGAQHARSVATRTMRRPLTCRDLLQRCTSGDGRKTTTQGSRALAARRPWEISQR